MNETSENIDLDQKDLLILYYLQQDSRISLTELGKKLHITPAAVSYRFNKLIEKNVIEKFSVKLNHKLLTPNYNKFLVMVSVENLLQSEDLMNKLLLSTYFERILEIATSNSIYGITLPLSNKNLQDLTILLNESAMRQFSLIPILKDNSYLSSEIVGENISQVYCPLCQKSVTGKGIISAIGDQELAFCCRECRDQFTLHYNKITKNE